MRRASVAYATTGLVACSSPTVPRNTVAVTVTFASRPTTTFAVTNFTSESVQLVSCDGSLGVAHPANTSTVRVCTGSTSLVTILADTRLDDAVPIVSAGKFVISVTLADRTARSTDAFIVP